VTDTLTPSDERPTPPEPAAPRGELAGGPWRLGIVVAAVVALGLLAGKSWLLIILALSLMIVLHELGHFLAAKWAGMKVTEFFLFFGPKIWSFKRGDTEYGIKLIPVGAYVRIIGMNNLDVTDPDDEPLTYRQQSFPKRLLVVSAGSIAHLLQAFVLFLVAFAWVGVPGGSEAADRIGAPAPTWHIGEVVDGEAAAAAGLRPGDIITGIDGKKIEDFSDIGQRIIDRPGDEVTLSVDRKGTDLELPATIGHRADDPDSGFLGVSVEYDGLGAVTVGTGRSVWEAGEATVTTMRDTVSGLSHFFTGGFGRFAGNVIDGRSAQGPVVASSGSSGGRVATSGDEDRLVSIYGVARLGAASSERGMGELLLLLAYVNVSIGLLNMLPLLPLDGGHAMVAIYERVRSRKGRRHMADVSRLLPLTYAVFLVLVLIGASSVYLDIVDPIGVG
jgi:membrane-associated protease RseP (regulator of RpoE activity)